MTRALRLDVSLTNQNHRIDLLRAQIACATGDLKAMLTNELARAIQHRANLLMRIRS